jgi:hypothetical protein
LSCSLSRHHLQPTVEQQLVNGAGTPPDLLSHQFNDIGKIGSRTGLPGSLVQGLLFAAGLHHLVGFSAESCALGP